MAYPFLWVASTPNKKTGDIPTAYVGKTIQDCRASCEGCALLEEFCYAWHGFAKLSLARMEIRIQSFPEQYTLENAMRYRKPEARVGRVGAMGDPARGDRKELRRADRLARESGMDGLIGYTHFWREEQHQDLRDLLLASCEFIEDAVEARAAGWVPALLLPWDFSVDTGAKTFDLPNGERGLICPAQTRDGITCNDCRLCWLDHPVWKAGKIVAIGFLDHSKPANREKRRWQKGKQLPLYGQRPQLKRARTV